MEVRCGKCDKLFRVPDEKVSGKGIRFVCTRCGEYVVVSKEEPEREKGTASVTDKAEPAPKPIEAPQKTASEEPSIEGPAPAPKPIEPSGLEAMEARCRACDKLFRVPKGKFVGKGIKFACTRCGEYIKITQEEFETYILSRTAPPVPSPSEVKEPAQEQPPSASELTVPDLSVLKEPDVLPKEQPSFMKEIPPKEEATPAVVTEQTLEFEQKRDPRPESVSVPGPKPGEMPGIEAMEVKCGACDKLFRVPKGKFVGKGIKFACTRCGEYIKITQKEFENYILSKTAVSVLDLLEPKPKTAKEQQEPEVQEPEVKEPEVKEPEIKEPEIKEPEIKEPEVKEPEVKEPEVKEPEVKEPEVKEQPLAAEPTAFDFSTVQEPEATPVAYEPQPIQEIAKQPESSPRPEPQSAPEPEPGPEPEPTVTPQPKTEPLASRRSVPATIPEIIPAVSGPEATPVFEPPIKEAASSVSTQAGKKATRAGMFSWVEKLLLSLVAVIIIGFAGYALFTYTHPSIVKDDKAASVESLIEGLQIKNVTSSKDAHGDILIEGMVENTSDKEKAAWYVVVDVYDAQGEMLDKLRVLKGKQLFSRRDYRILEERGVNVRELKEKNLEEQGIVIPAKGSVPLSIRYVQPPESMASLKPKLQTYDPVRLFREIAEDNK